MVLYFDEILTFALVGLYDFCYFYEACCKCMLSFALLLVLYRTFAGTRWKEVEQKIERKIYFRKIDCQKEIF